MTSQLIGVNMPCFEVDFKPHQQNSGAMLRYSEQPIGRVIFGTGAAP